ncbi:MAG: DNA-directed RNA polymerase [Pararhizobium sp.]
MNIHVDQFQRQAELEADMAGFTRSRFYDKYNKELESERGSGTRTGTYLLGQSILALAGGISRFVDDVYSGKPGPKAVAARLIRDMDKQAVAYLVARAVLNRLMYKKAAPLISLSKLVGQDLEAESRFTYFEATNPGLFKRVGDKLSRDGATEQHKRTVLTYTMGKYDIPWDRWGRNDILILGMKMVELFCSHTNIAQIEQAYVSGETDAPHDQWLVSLTPVTSDWIAGSVLRGELMQPSYMPTIIPPRPWTGMDEGGYHTNAVRQVHLVRRARPEHRRLIEQAHLGAVLGGLNAIQATAWQVNAEVLDVMEKLVATGNGIAGLIPTKDYDLPDRPVDIDTNPEALKTWKWQARDVHTKNLQLRQARLEQQGVLELAQQFAKEPAIYFPHNLDFRGRAYPVPLNLHPQGSDSVKALLRFSQGMPLGEDGDRWLAIHGANTFGIDKVDFADRIEWVGKNERDIVRSALDPVGYRWWTEADKPWCFLAFCREWTGYAADPSTFVSHLPIALDGSCNGLQHFSAMLLDDVGGSAVNLMPAAKPQDIYQVVADRVMAQLRLISSASGGDADRQRWAYGWLHFGIDRKITKRPVMVLPYGGTPRSCLKYVDEEVRSRIAKGLQHNFGDDLKRAIGFLASLVWDSIGEVVIAARKAMDWLQKTARVIAKLNQPIFWTTPSGFPAFQAYMDTRLRRVKTRIAGSIIRPAVYEETDAIHRSKQATSISPNFVHSLDASAMMLTVDRLRGEGITSFAMIHDSYGTHACNTTLLSTTLREVFVRMYETDPLTRFRDQLLETYPEIADELPVLPEKGTLNLWTIMSSDFFFA